MLRRGVGNVVKHAKAFVSLDTSNSFRRVCPFANNWLKVGFVNISQEERTLVVRSRLKRSKKRKGKMQTQNVQDLRQSSQRGIPKQIANKERVSK